MFLQLACLPDLDVNPDVSGFYVGVEMYYFVVYLYESGMVSIREWECNIAVCLHKRRRYQSRFESCLCGSGDILLCSISIRDIYIREWELIVALYIHARRRSRRELFLTENGNVLLRTWLPTDVMMTLQKKNPVLA